MNTLPTTLDSIAHIVQAALTPVFLLSGLAALLNVFSTRLGRIDDRSEAVNRELAAARDAADHAELVRQAGALRRRSRLLDAAVAFATAAAAATCAATGTLLVGALRDRTLATALFWLLGFALACSLIAVLSFLVEVIIAGWRARALSRAAERVPR